MEMKKYMTPEMVVMEMKLNNALLTMSDGAGSTPSGPVVVGGEGEIEE